MTLQDEIRSAFQSVFYPGNAKLTSCSCEECQRLVGGLRGKNWQVITMEDVVGIATIDETLSALSPYAFHFYLPGLMLLTIADEDSGTLGNSIIHRFTVHDREPQSAVAASERVVRLLATAQRIAVRHFLEWLRGFETNCPHLIDSAIDNIAHDRVLPYSTVTVQKWVDAYVKKHKEES